MWHVENRSEMSVLDRLRFFTMKAEQAVERTNEITKMFFPVIFEIVNDYTGFLGK